MNERIKELALQAGIHDDVCSMCPIHELEKFAELIIEECVSISNIERDNSVGCGYVTQTIGQRIRKHFGVNQ